MKSEENWETNFACVHRVGDMVYERIGSIPVIHPYSSQEEAQKEFHRIVIELKQDLRIN